MTDEAVLKKSICYFLRSEKKADTVDCNSMKTGRLLGNTIQNLVLLKHLNRFYHISKHNLLTEAKKQLLLDKNNCTKLDKRG